MISNEKEINAIISLAGPERFFRFVKVVADRQEVWGLYREGWALAQSDEGEKVFPLWPAREYAELCAVSEWDGYKAEPIELENFLNNLLPQLAIDGVLPGVFYTPTDKGVTPSVNILKAAIEKELENY